MRIFFSAFWVRSSVPWILGSSFLLYSFILLEACPSLPEKGCTSDRFFLVLFFKNFHVWNCLLFILTLNNDGWKDFQIRNHFFLSILKALLRTFSLSVPFRFFLLYVKMFIFFYLGVFSISYFPLEFWIFLAKCLGVGLFSPIMPNHYAGQNLKSEIRVFHVQGIFLNYFTSDSFFSIFSAPSVIHFFFLLVWNCLEALTEHYRGLVDPGLHGQVIGWTVSLKNFWYQYL